MNQSNNVEYDNSNHSEDKIQSDCFMWLWNNYPKTRGLLYHIRNGGSVASAREGAKFKAMGVVRGIPDLHMPIPCTSEGTFYASLYIEMKTVKGKLSKEQIEIHEKLKSASNCVVLCKDLPHFKEIVLYWLETAGIDYKNG
jgi:hypothetical protein